MSRPQWLDDVEIAKAHLKDLLDAAHTYAGKGETIGLYDLYIKIGRQAEAIAKIYQDNLPLH